MDMVRQIFGTHPKSAQIDAEQYARAAIDFGNCGITTTVCADACLSEPHVQMLAKCIALNLDCADSCATTARTVSRIGFADKAVLRTQLEACREACRACAEECERHEDMEHCRVCAQMCRSCEQMCTKMLEGMMAVA